MAYVHSSRSHKRANEQRSEEDQEVELSRRKGKEPCLAEFEDGELMSIELLSNNQDTQFGWAGIVRQDSKEPVESPRQKC